MGMSLVVIMAVRLFPVLMIVVVVNLVQVFYSLIIYLKMFLFSSGMIVIVIMVLPAFVDMGGPVSVGMVLVLGGISATGGAKQAQNGQKEK